LQDFEQTQKVIGTPSQSSSIPSTARNESKQAERGIKRKFQLEDDEVSRLVEDAEERALKQLEKEQVRVNTSFDIPKRC